MRIVTFLFFICVISIQCTHRFAKQIRQDEQMTTTASIRATPGLFEKNANWDASVNLHFIYSNLFGLEENTIAVDSTGVYDLYITSPTLVWTSRIYMPLLIRPGDELTASMNENGDVVFSSPGNPARTKELERWQLLMDLFNTHRWQFRSESNLNLASDLRDSNYEEIARVRAGKFLARSQTVIDSLLPPTHENTEMRQAASSYIHAKFAVALLDYYWANRKEFGKPLLMKQLESAASWSRDIKTANDLIYYSDFLTALTEHFVSTKGSYIRVVDRQAFDKFLSSAKIYFNGVSRDFLITRTLYAALRGKIITYTEYVSLSEKEISDKNYKLICSYLGKQINNNELTAAMTAENSFVPFDSKQEVTGQQLFTQFKGRLIFVDFWASWCIPCRKEMPQLRMLKRQYADRNIRFVSISLDNSIPDWEKASGEEGLDRANLLLKPENDTTYTFMGHSIKEIPRYMIIDRNGVVVNADAPGPGDKALRPLLEKYLKEL